MANSRKWRADLRLANGRLQVEATVKGNKVASRALKLNNP